MQLKSNIKSLLSLAALLSASVAFGQQDPYYSFNMFNRLTYNPGYSGGDKPGYTCLTMTSKKQWFGTAKGMPDPTNPDSKLVSGTPMFENLNVVIPITKYPKDGSSPYIKHGIGISVENDKLGVETGLNFTLSYAFKLQLPNEQTLSFGPSIGMLQKSHDGAQLRTFSQLVNNILDPNVPNSLVKGVKPDYNFGVYYTKQNIGKYANCYAGLGVRHLVESKIEYNLPNGGGASYWQMRRNIYIHAGCEKGIGNNTLQPSIMIRSDMTKTQLELSANYLVEDKYWVGAAYRHGTLLNIKNFNVDALCFQGGMKFPKQNMKAGLAYDFTLNRMNRILSGYNTSYGSVELMVQYCFKPKTTYNPKIYRDTRRMDGWH